MEWPKVYFSGGEKNISKYNYVPNINVNKNINCWYVCWYYCINEIKKNKNGSAKKIQTQATPSPVKKILNIHRRKKNLNKSYWKFDFSIGTVLVIFSFLWTDNAPCVPLASPLTPPIGKNCNIHHRKKN